MNIMHAMRNGPTEYNYVSFASRNFKFVTVVPNTDYTHTHSDTDSFIVFLVRQRLEA